MERKRREAEGEGEVGGEEGEGWILLGGQEDEKDTGLCFTVELWVVVDGRSREGGSLLVALFIVFHGRLAIGYGLFFFGFPAFLWVRCVL